MLADADRELIHHFFSKEDARRKRSLVLVWVLIIATDLLMLVAYFQTEDIGDSLAAGMASPRGGVDLGFLCSPWICTQSTNHGSALERLAQHR
jgi:hypothetical protein